MPFILGKNKSQVDQKLADSLKTLNTSTYSSSSTIKKSRQRGSALMLALRPIMMEAEELARDRQ